MLQLIQPGETLDDVLKRHGFKGGIAAMDALLVKHTGKRGRTQKGGQPPGYVEYQKFELRTRAVQMYGPAYERAMRQQGVAAGVEDVGAEQGWGASAALVAAAAVLAAFYSIYTAFNEPARVMGSMGGGKHAASVDPALHTFLHHLEERVDPCFFAVLSALTTPTHFKDGRISLDVFSELCVHAGIALGDIPLEKGPRSHSAMRVTSTRRSGSSPIRRSGTARARARAHRRG